MHKPYQRRKIIAGVKKYSTQYILTDWSLPKLNEVALIGRNLIFLIQSRRHNTLCSTSAKRTGGDEQIIVMLDKIRAKCQRIVLSS